MKYITGHPTSNFPPTSNNLVIRKVVLDDIFSNKVHRVSYQMLRGGLPVPEAARNLAVAVQDAIRIYYGVCTPVQSLFRVNNPGQVYSKLLTGPLTIPLRVVFVYYGTATSAEGNWTFFHQFWSSETPTPLPYDYTAPCMTGGGPKPR